MSTVNRFGTRKKTITRTFRIRQEWDSILQELMEYPETLKAVPTKMDECSLCMKCVPICVEQAITVKNDSAI